MLATQTISSFSGGIYLDSKVSGHVVITVSKLGGNNAVVNGLFFDAATGMSSQSSLAVVSAGSVANPSSPSQPLSIGSNPSPAKSGGDSRSLASTSTVERPVTRGTPGLSAGFLAGSPGLDGARRLIRRRRNANFRPTARRSMTWPWNNCRGPVNTGRYNVVRLSEAAMSSDPRARSGDDFAGQQPADSGATRSSFSEP